MSEHIIQALREIRGLEPEDTSQDDDIIGMSPNEKFEQYCQWHGLLGWASNIRDTVFEIYGVNYEA